MGRLGFIHEKLDIKILILYILRRLPGTVDPETLAELCQCDSGVGYFDYSDCRADLVDTGHITESEEGYCITEKGARNADICFCDIPGALCDIFVRRSFRLKGIGGQIYGKPAAFPRLGLCRYGMS